jgi:hypothetical protein
MTDPAFYDEPLDYDFGFDFNYASWNQDTEITLTNVPWDSGYDFIIPWKTQAQIDAYIDKSNASNLTIDNMSYLKPNQPIEIDVPYNAVIQYNYVRASNPVQPIEGDVARNYYYFILDAVYVAGNNTRLTLQLDLWTTYGRDVKFGNAFVERGHWGIARPDSFDSFGRKNLTVPEGIDTGAEYQVVMKRREDIANAPMAINDMRNTQSVLVLSTIDLSLPIDEYGTEGTPGEPNKNPPKTPAAQGSSMQGIPSGCSIYVFSSPSSLTEWLRKMKEKPWVTAGIVSLTLIPALERWWPDFQYGPRGTPTEVTVVKPFNKRYNMAVDWRNSEELAANIPPEYRHLRKFYTAPYMWIEMTTWSGTPVMLRPEAWANPNCLIMERISLIPPQQRITFHPRGYNSRSAREEPLYPALTSLPEYEGVDGDDNGDYLDIGTMITSFPTLSILNNGGILALAQNTHSNAFATRSADWSEQKAMRGAATSFDNTSRGIQAGQDIGTTSRGADLASTIASNDAAAQSAWTAAATGVGGGVLSGMVAGPSGAAMGALGGGINAIGSGLQTGIGIDAANRQQSIRSGASLDTQYASNSAEQYVANKNRQLAEWAAGGDKENAIRAIQARIQDTALTPNSMSGQIGGDAINFINNTVELSLRWKMIDEAAIRRIGDMWLRYGYAIEQFMKLPADLMVMNKFTYWKMTELYIRASPMPESFKTAIRGIFMKGTTMYADPDDIGMIAISDNRVKG